ncbi:protein-PII uridylyltransferase [Shewanella sp. GutDb-MelDb]|uniref:protein-PII uridylyltransferase n=1 Tax=Shewanella sp. GutDb-MelDb TaxID=2058316 RepID=UPI000C7C7F47|nr:protein-PII uridylyltransferase [Shewanella sp. GutDb-MelDb]PKG56345.1 protein-PII uridylyltransferase [Shewanella sp. GutDb-MelDb]
MPIRFLYVDDDKTEQLKPLMDELLFHSEGMLEIEHIQVCSMKKVKCKFLDEGFDGLIIDQKLDAANAENETFDYWGTSLAQNLRTEMIGGGMPASPIVLLSNEEVFVKYYNTDESAHNLFDFTLEKTQVSRTTKYAQQASRILVALANAYKVAREQTLPLVATEAKPFELLEPLLKWDQSVFEYTDKRFVEYASSKSEDVHTLVSLILNSLVRSAGILVTEDMLATKLGIDIQASDDWASLKLMLEPFRYTGAFAELKERWWMSRIEDWWDDSSDTPQVIRALKATERVTVIKQFTSLEHLVAINPKYQNGKQSEKYWVNCMVSGTPLDPFDALVANKVDLKSWEEFLYLDPETVFERRHQPDYAVHSDYQKKVKSLYRRLTNG